MWKAYQNFQSEIMITYQLPIEIEHALPDLPLVDFRKEELRKGLFSTPTNAHLNIGREVDDY
jgi:hypothetical protein